MRKIKLLERLRGDLKAAEPRNGWHHFLIRFTVEERLHWDEIDIESILNEEDEWYRSGKTWQNGLCVR